MFAFLLLPTYTVLFAGEEWLSTNFSVRAVISPSYYRGFVVWAFLTMGYFYILLIRLALRVPCTPLRRGVFLLTLAACVSLCYGVFIPYLPRDIPRWAALHVALAAGSCVLLLAAILLLLLYWREWGMLRVWLVMNGAYGILFLWGGMVTSALEVVFVLSAELLLREMWVRKNKHDL